MFVPSSGRNWRVWLVAVLLSHAVTGARAGVPLLGDARCVTAGHAAHLPTFSPDGRWLATSCADVTGLAVVSRDGTGWRVLGGERGAAYHACWTPAGDALWVRGGKRITLAGARAPADPRATGDPLVGEDGVTWLAYIAGDLLPDDAGAAWTLTADGQFAVGATRDGRGFVLDLARRRLQWLPDAHAGAFYGPVAAPRGHQIVANRLGTGLVLVDLDTGTERALGEGTSPVWWPDGSGVVCEVTRDDGHDIVSSALTYVPLAAGGARVDLGIAHSWCAQHAAISSDGAWCAFDTPAAGVFVAPVRAGQAP